MDNAFRQPYPYGYDTPNVLKSVALIEMATHQRLSFASVEVLPRGIVELTVNHGVDVSRQMVAELHGFLAALEQAHHLLVNKINAYSYSYEAQQTLLASPHIGAVALVAYSRISEVSVRSLLLSFPRSTANRVALFQDREKALEWLAGLPRS